MRSIDSQAIAERWNYANGSEYFTMRYVFDQNGSVIGFCTHYPGFPEGYFEHYLFAKNLQGDVVAMYMVGSGPTLIATYEYDSWGKVLSVKDANGSEITNPSHLALRQPFRYRGYHYDMETGYYYLQSRYYDSQICRFINADAYLSTGQNFVSCNMFAYCLNNPASHVDISGEEAILLTLFGVGVSITPIGWCIFGGALVAAFLLPVVEQEIVPQINIEFKDKGKSAPKPKGKSKKPQSIQQGDKNNKQNPNHASDTLYNKDSVRVDYEYYGNGRGNVHIQIRGDNNKYYYNSANNLLIMTGGRVASAAIQKLLKDPRILHAIYSGLSKIRSLGGG